MTRKVANIEFEALPERLKSEVNRLCMRSPDMEVLNIERIEANIYKDKSKVSISYNVFAQTQNVLTVLSYDPAVNLFSSNSMTAGEILKFIEKSSLLKERVRSKKDDVIRVSRTDKSNSSVIER